MKINKRSTEWLLFTSILCLMLFDRSITLLKFGFDYTDIDQTVMWNGALDYSNGIFHEPFFYGQAYNYMLESLLAVPLVWMNLPVYKALPIITCLISLLPFVALAFLFMNRENYFWAYLCLAFPVLLPVEYNFLTTIPRGFIQSHLFVSFLFLPLFDPQSKRNVTILYIASASCFIANSSSLLIIFPVSLLVFLHHYKSSEFYLKSLLVIPFLIVDQLAKHFYKIHPERVLHTMTGLRLDGKTFLEALNVNLFEGLFPFISNFGMAYFLVFTVLVVIAFYKSCRKELWFVIAILFLLIITLAVPKIQEVYPNGGVFFTPSRFYLYLPILLILTFYLIFPQIELKKLTLCFLLISCGVAFTLKNYEIQKTIAQTIKSTAFPIANNQDLINRASELNDLVAKYNIDLIVHANSEGWNYIFDSYAFNPLTRTNNQSKETISVNLTDDRRTWLYSTSRSCRQVLLNGFSFDHSKLEGLDYESISNRLIVIKNNNLPTAELFQKLNLQFGNKL